MLVKNLRDAGCSRLGRFHRRSAALHDRPPWVYSVEKLGGFLAFLSADARWYALDKAVLLACASSGALKPLALQYRRYVTPNAALGGDIHRLLAIRRKF